MSVAYTVRLDHETNIKLTKYAKENKRSKAFYIKEAVDSYLFDLEELALAIDIKNNEDDKLLSSEEAITYLKNRHNV